MRRSTSGWPKRSTALLPLFAAGIAAAAMKARPLRRRTGEQPFPDRIASADPDPAPFAAQLVAAMGERDPFSTVTTVIHEGAFEGPHRLVEIPDGRSTLVARTTDGRLLSAQFSAPTEGSPPDSVELRYLSSGSHQGAYGAKLPVFDASVDSATTTVFDSFEMSPSETEMPTCVTISLGPVEEAGDDEDAEEEA